MKNAKRILCLALTLLMVLSSVGVFASFSDVPDTSSYSQAVSSLNQLGIITGYDDGTFKPDNDVTRAEFCAMLMRSMGYGNIGATSSAGLPFSDVSDTNSDISWAIKNIDTAYKMGIVNGYEDGTFRPSANVAYEEAVKMVVCALGYGSAVSIDVEPWYANFISQATTIGLLKNAQNLGSAERPASRSCIAQMLYDALEIPLVENNVLTTKTLLSDYLGYIKGTGYISANGLTSLEDPDVNLRDNQIQIRAKEPNSSVYEVHTYQTDKAAEFMDKLGYQVDFYYPKTSGTDTIRTLFSYDVRENTVLELNSDQIDEDDTTNTVIRYYATETSNKSAANLASDNIVIYNGKLYGRNAASSVFSNSMIPNVGTVTLLDSDKDGKYDLITIWDYQIYYVTSKSSSDYSIVDSTTRVADRKLILDVDMDTNLEIVDKTGKKVSFSSISTGNVVCYAESNYAGNGGTAYKRAVVINDKATGSVSTVISGEEIIVGGTTYKFSNAAPWMDNGNDNNELTEPRTGESSTFALDILGNVFAYNKSDSNNQSVSYGYLIAYNNNSNSAFATINDLQLRVLTQGGTKTDFYIYKGTSVNGKTVSNADQLIDELRSGASYQNTGSSDYTNIQQVIKYTTTTYNGKTCLDSIYTVTSDTYTSGNNQDIVSDKIYSDSRLQQGSVNVKYTNSILSANNIQLNVGSSIVFNVPGDSERSDSDKFNNRKSWSKNKEYSVEAFDVRSNAPRVIVIYGGSSSKDIDEYSPLYVMQSIGESVNDGDNMYQAEGIKVTTGSSSTFKDWISTSSNSIMRSAEIGDIYRGGTDSDGYTNFDRDYIVYNSSIKGNCYMDTNSRNKDNWFDTEYTVIYGSVYSSNSDDGMVIVTEYLEEGDELTGDEYTIPRSSFNSAKILAYDESGSKMDIKDISSDKDAVLNGMDAYNADHNPAKVVMYMYYGQVKLLAITEGYYRD